MCIRDRRIDTVGFALGSLRRVRGRTIIECQSDAVGNRGRLDEAHRARESRSGQVALPEVRDLFVEPHRTDRQVELVPRTDDWNSWLVCSWSTFSRAQV